MNIILKSTQRTLGLAVIALWFGPVLAAQDRPLAVYQNYDFVPGDRILFDDDFKADQDGEFASHWKLESGQAVINKVEGEKAFFLTDGNYGKVSPRMKTASYLGNSFTVEFDFMMRPGGAPTGILFKNAEDGDHQVFFAATSVSTSYFPHDLSKDYPASLAEGFVDKWHHAALAFRDKQIKVYVDQLRALVMPDCECVLKTLAVGGIATEDQPLIFKNFRLAEGGGMNMLSKLTTDGKIVTHGILFDSGKAVLKPESMGVLNEVAKLLKENAGIKLEIDGHTDTFGDANSNLKLSQDRADSVKRQLVGMGIDGARLTTKGYGQSKPIDDNTTPEGKANNRRVEFVKVG